MRATTITAGGLAAASANNVCLSQTPTSAFTLNGATVSGGVAILDVPRRVLFTFAGAEAGKLVTIVGTTWGGTAQTEVLTAVSASTAYTALDFLTITSITTATAFAGAVTVGTNGLGSSRWMRLDEWIGESVAIQCTATGTVNYTVQGTMQDPNSPTNPVNAYSVVWTSVDDSDLVAATATASGVISALPIYIKVTINSGTGSVSTVVSQASQGGGGGGGGGGGVGTDVNLIEIDGTAVDVDAGAASAGTLRTVTASDSPDVVALEAIQSSTATVNVAFDTSTLYNGATALTPKFALISASSSGDNTIVAAVVSKKIRVLAYNIIGSAAVNARFESAAGGTALTGLKYIAAAGGGICAPFNPVGWFETVAGQLLNLELSGAVAVGGELVYVEV